MAAANPGGSHGRGGGVASAAARTSRALAAAPRVRVVGGENLLCGTQADRKQKEKFSQAPDMSMVQVLMQQTITGVIRSQSLAPKAAQAATLAASSAASAALGVLCAQLDIPSIVPPDPAASKPKSQKHTRATATDATPTASSSHKTTASSTASSALMTVSSTCTTTHATAHGQRLLKMRRVTRQTDTVDTAVRTINLHAPGQPAPPPELGNHARGALVVVRPQVAYAARDTYTFRDICRIGEALEKSELNERDLDERGADGELKLGIPRSTMRNKWAKEDTAVVGVTGQAGVPHWRAERDVRRRTSLSSPGPGPILGAAEDRIAVEIARMAMKNMPYEQEEVEQMLLDTAIALQLEQRPGKLYDLYSNVAELLRAFLGRCKKGGLLFTRKGGKGLSKQRWFNARPEVLDAYRDDVIRPALLAFQLQHGALTLADVGNWDDTAIDLCDFAAHGNY